MIRTKVHDWVALTNEFYSKYVDSYRCLFKYQ